MALIALPNGAIECILSFAQTPKDAVRLAAVSKRFLHLEQTVLYKRLTVRATNTAALAWMRARGNRIIGGSIECDGAPLCALKNAYETARATLLSPSPTPVRLLMSSKLFAAVLALLKRDAARMVELLKGHLQASLSGPSYEHVVESAEREMYNMGYDSEYDIRSKASLAWVIDGVIHTGERGQLDVVLYMWQSRGNEPCKFSLEVRRGSSGQVLLPATTAKKAACTRADEKTLDWWLVAADLFLTPVDGTGRTAAHFETKRVEAADGIRGDESD